MISLALTVAATLTVPCLQARDAKTLTESWPNGKARVVRDVSRDGQGGWINDGAFASFFEDGARESFGRYSKGLRVGVWESFHPNGKQASKGRYLKGRMDGKWSFWREDGVENLADSGVYQPIVILDEHKRVTCEGQQRDGEAHGEWSFYWRDGALQSSGSFRSGARHGEWIFFGVDGAPVRLFESGLYDADQRLGEIAPERWSQIEAHAGERDAGRARDAKPAPAWFASPQPADTVEDSLREVGADHGARSDELARALLTLQLDDPAQRAIAERWCTTLRGFARSHHFGWPTDAWGGAPRELSDVVRAWSALLATRANDWIFWRLELDSTCSAQNTPTGPHSTDCPLLRAPPRRDGIGSASLTTNRERRWYELRFADAKSRTRLCGGPNEAAALDAALNWLVLHQDPSGAWLPGAFPEQCARHAAHEACGGAGEDQNQVGVTSLAMLALLGDGSTLTRGARRDALRLATAWLLSRQDVATGRFGDPRWTTFMYDHAFATAALSEALVFDESSTVRRAVQRAVDYLEVTQRRSGERRTAWSYNTASMPDHVDSSLTSCILLALGAARDADVEVAQDVFAGGLALLEQLTDPATGRTGYDSPGSFSARVSGVNDHMPLDRAEPLTALALTARLACGQRGKTQPMLAEGLALLLKQLPQWKPDDYRVDVYYWGWGAQALSWMSAEFDTRPWTQALRTALLDGQSLAGGSAGSWDPRHDPWGYTGGRVYMTAMGALALESQLRMDPLRFATARK